MLPTPAATRYHRKIRVDTSPQKRLRETLTRRSRVTNLGVFLLASLCTLSILFNLRCWAFPPALHPDTLPQNSRLSSIFSSVERPATRRGLKHLIVVPCHAIWTGDNSWLDEKDWMLESYQKGPGRVRAFYEHISQSAKLAKEDPHSLLVFSGGQTKSLSSTTEAESYLRLAQKASLLPGESPLLPFARVTTENYALDSFQNLLFSITRFREFTGHYPTTITVVGYEFKRPRFTELHRGALRWPKDRFKYIGVDPDHDDGSNAKAIEGERQNGYLPYTLDKYGCHSVLLDKRRQRNPYSRFHPYLISSPELAPLINWCPDAAQGEGLLFTGRLPWDRTIPFMRDT